MIHLLLVLLLTPLVALAHNEATPFPKQLQIGNSLTGLNSKDAHSYEVIRITVPPSTSKLTLTTRGQGSCEVYVRPFVHPADDGSDALYRSTNVTTKHRIEILNPSPGVWYVGLLGTYNGFSSLTLKASSSLQKGAIPLPVFHPAPGILPGPITIQISAKGIRGTVHYTTDGSEPTAASPSTLASPLTLSSDTTVKARAIDRNGSVGPVETAEYRILAPDTVTTLTPGTAITHLAGLKGSRHLFRITSPGSRKILVIADGGTGSTQLAAAHNFIPPPKAKAKKGNGITSGSKKIEITATEPGDYYITLEGKSPFAQRSLLVTLADDGCDLIPWAPTLEPYVSTETFDPDSCDVLEGMIGAGTRRLLRYSTEVRNIGNRDLVMPPPEDNPFFEYQACHGHFHFKGFAQSRITDLDGNVLRTSRKVSFCLLDTNRWNPNATKKRRYNCASQGIQSGWGDVYDSGLPGQWIEIDSLPAGNYYLELTVNPDAILPETRLENNTIRVPVTIPAP